MARTRPERHDWTLHNLALVQMTHAAAKKPAEISGGMKQRVGLARALAMEPKVLLLSDRIVMMTNGPAAEVGGIVRVDLPRPRKRIEVDALPAYVSARHEVIEFLYARHAALRSAA